MPTKSAKVSSIKNEQKTHPYHFYRDENPDLPIRETPPINDHYQSIFEHLRNKFLPVLGYTPKRNLKEFEAYKARIAQWNDIAWQGDRIGDNLAKMFRELPPGQGRKQFEQVLENGIDSIKNPHPALIELAEHIDNIPKLFDMNKVKRGSEILAAVPYFSYYMAMLSQLGVGSNFGPIGRMVGASGRFFNIKKSASRLLETFKYVMGDMIAEDAFQAGSESLKDAYRVKLMHALVRNHAMQNEDKEIYDFENRGNPINMRESMGGAFVFGIMPLAMDLTLGSDHKATDLECIAEIGNIVAYINGTDYEFLPKSIDEHALFYDYMLATYEGLGPYATQLNQAIFIDVPKAIAQGQSSNLASKIIDFASVILSSLMIWSHGNKLCVEAGGIHTGLKAQLGTLIFPAYKYTRIVYDFLNRNIPGYQSRLAKRRAFNRKLYSDTMVNFMMKSLEQDLSMKFDGHDDSTAEDMNRKASA